MDSDSLTAPLQAHPITSPQSLSITLVAAVHALWDFLISSIALREGAKLLFIGSTLEIARRLVAMLWSALFDFFFITAEFEDRDETFTWMMFWLSRQPRWNRLRSIRVTTFRYGQSGVSNLVPGEEEEKRTGPSRRVAYVPSHSKALSMWFHKTWTSVTLTQTQGDMWNRRGDERLKVTQFSLFTRQISKLDDLLREAKLSFKKHSEGRINIYVSDLNNDWTLAGSRPRRPLASVVLDNRVKKRLTADIKEFLGSEKWYADRGIPWRRGYLLHGSPGTGKTSLIHSLAGEFGLDIYVIALSKKSLDDSTLNELITKIPPKCLAIMEDIDAAFYRGVSREGATFGTQLAPGQMPDELAPGTEPMQPSFQARMQSTSQITLSGLLGAIDGIAAQEGRLLFATTNKYSALDPALVRPGRLDVHIRFDLAGRKEAAALFRCFFPPESDDGKEAKEDEGSFDDESMTATVVDSGPGSPTHTSVSDFSSFDHSEDHKRDDDEMDTDDNNQPLSRAESKRLSETFASRIPEGEFSMASLQGLLMEYRTRPRQVAHKVGAWVEEERRRRSEREGRSSVPTDAEAKNYVSSVPKLGLMTGTPTTDVTID
ncbi:hypothetical protein ACEPAH_4184 [Sanghuangporus vaninii]